MVRYSSLHKGFPSTVTCFCEVHFIHELLKQRAQQRRMLEHHHHLLVLKFMLWHHKVSHETPLTFVRPLFKGRSSFLAWRGCSKGKFHPHTLSHHLKDYKCCEDPLQLTILRPKVWWLIFPSLRNSAHDLHKGSTSLQSCQDCFMPPPLSSAHAWA